MIFNKNEEIYDLDEHNRIVLIKDFYAYNNVMVHERLINSKYVEINKWITSLSCKKIDEKAHISNINIFQVQNIDGVFNSWYNYLEDKFVIPLDMYDELYTGIDNEFLDKYNAVIGVFEAKSDFEEDDIISYKNMINNETTLYSFEVKDGKYFVVLNLDGSIRGNRVFKGESIYKIRESINLLEYHSIENFMKRKKALCNIIKAERKKMYYNNNIYEDNSPYMDREIIRVLKLK